MAGPNHNFEFRPVEGGPKDLWACEDCLSVGRLDEGSESVDDVRRWLNVHGAEGIVLQFDRTSCPRCRFMPFLLPANSGAVAEAVRVALMNDAPHFFLEYRNRTYTVDTAVATQILRSLNIPF